MTSCHGRPTLCFVALNAYGAIAGEQARFIRGKQARQTESDRTRTTRAGSLCTPGGAEMQQTVVARELARRGYAVSFITLDHGQPEDETIDGVHILKAYRREAGLPGLRFLTPRLTGLWRAMHRADADVYYQRMAEQTTGLVAAFCRRHGRAFIFATASDFDCLSDLPRLVKARERRLYLYGLRRADRVFAQTRQQQRLLHDAFRVEAVVVPNAGRDLSDETSLLTGQGGIAPRVLWIGRFTPEKRLDWLVDLARRCPAITFDVVGGSGDDTPALRGLERDAASLANVVLHGRVPPFAVAEFYRRSAVLLCTSEREGFPNTFLEAFSLGIPVVTTFDPDGIVAGHGLGVVAETQESLARGLISLLSDRGRLEACGRAARAYFDEHHDVRRVADLYERELAALSITVRRDAGKHREMVQPSDA